MGGLFNDYQSSAPGDIIERKLYHESKERDIMAQQSHPFLSKPISVLSPARKAAVVYQYHVLQFVSQRIKEHPAKGSGPHHESYNSFTAVFGGGCIICKRCWRECQDSYSEDQLISLSTNISYKWEKDLNSEINTDDWISSLPENTVQLLFRRLERNTEIWQHVFVPV